jgi:hypothetical protein
LRETGGAEKRELQKNYEDADSSGLNRSHFPAPSLLTVFGSSWLRLLSVSMKHLHLVKGNIRMARLRVSSGVRIRWYGTICHGDSA